MRLVAVFVLGALGACSPGAPATTDGNHDGTTGGDGGGNDTTDGAKSGTRLKLTWYDFGDGTRQWNSLYDAQRKESCFLYPAWSDGNVYCTPAGSGDIAFTNVGCTQPVQRVYRDPSCTQTPLPYVIDVDDSKCTTTPAHLYQHGAQVPVVNYYYKNADGSCGGPYTGASYDFYQLGAEIPPSELVKIDIGPPEGSTRLAERFFTSADGMKVPASLHDAMLSVDCSPVSYDGATASCQPSSWYAGESHNTTCTQAELDQAGYCPAPEILSYTPDSTCPIDPPSFFTVGSQISSSPLYVESNGVCYPVTGSPTDHYFTLGTPLAIASMTRGPDSVPGHRIQLEHFTTTDGLRIRDFGVFDSQEATDCYPTTLPDGSIRCVPYGGTVTTFYTTSQCTTTVDLVQIATGPGSCGAPYIPKYARKDITPLPGSCAYNTEVHPITTPYAGQAFVLNGTCLAYTPFQAKLYSIGAAVPLTEFVAASISTDP